VAPRRGSTLLFCQATRLQRRDDLVAVADAELLVGSSEMHLDGLEAEEQLVRNLSIRRSHCGGTCFPPLTGGERRRAGAGVSAGPGTRDYEFLAGPSAQSVVVSSSARASASANGSRAARRWPSWRNSPPRATSARESSRRDSELGYDVHRLLERGSRRSLIESRAGNQSDGQDSWDRELASEPELLLDPRASRRCGTSSNQR
jgi:hypothetical protein